MTVGPFFRLLFFNHESVLHRGPERKPPLDESLPPDKEIRESYIFTVAQQRVGAGPGTVLFIALRRHGYQSGRTRFPSVRPPPRREI